MVYRILCLRIWRSRDRDMERFWRDFTWSVVNMDFIFEELEGGIHTGDDGLVLQELEIDPFLS